MNDDTLSPQSLSIEPLRRNRITAISSAAQRRPLVLVLGMHRSGTSLCSHILSALGVDMADNIAGPWNASVTPDNPQGHWERWEIVEFHDRILGLFNRAYLGRFHDFGLPVAWWADPRVVQIRREIVAFLERRMGDGYFGFKDPRTVRLMPVWHQILNELKLAPKLVLCLRNPVQVARSLNARDGLDRETGEYRWLVHMVDFFRYTSNFDFCTVEYEEWFNNPLANFEKLQKFLDLSWQQSEADLGLVLSGIIDPGARHDDSDHQEAGQPLVRTLYKLASRASQDSEARDQITYIVSQFVGFQQLQRPFQRAFEDVAKTAAKYPEIEQQATALQATVNERDAAVESADARATGAEGRLAEALLEIEQQATALRAVVSERDAAVAAADARAAGAEGRLAEALLEIDHQRGQSAELARERDEVSRLNAALAERDTAVADLSRRANELLSALQAAQAEAAAREAALSHAEQEAQDRAAAALAIQSEVAALRDALTQAERAGQERRVAADAMQAEVTALREALAQAEREAQQHAAAAQALAAEVGGLRGGLARAERDARERAAAVAASQAEIVALQGTLTAARQVGTAAIAAFRASSATPMEPDRPVGWRHAMMRLFGAGTSV
jgi:hypothetical protein